MIRSREKLSMWSSLPPYLGGKRRLCPLFFREIDRLIPTVGQTDTSPSRRPGHPTLRPSQCSVPRAEEHLELSCGRASQMG